MKMARSYNIIQALLRIKNTVAGEHHAPSWYAKAKYRRNRNISIKRFLIDISLISLGVFSAGFGLRGFLLPNHFIDGGAVGISLLISAVSHISLPYLLILINIPFVIIGFKLVGRMFVIKTTIAIAMLAIVVGFVHYPHVTQDKLLIAIFGGFFLGLGTGLAVRGGGVIDGTEVLAISLTRRLGLTIGDIILIINILIFSVAALVLSVETAMYSILTYLSAAKTVDFVIEGIEEYTAVTIISVKAEIIRTMIIEKMGRGVTTFKGEKGFGKRGHIEGDMKIIYTVITRLEVSKLNAEIEKIDPNAFVITSSVKDTRGGMIKKRPMKD
ncbi:MAG TPA: YitT family protein [Puia sp.]|nr:YitT family protein [Puia sp.]